MAKRKMQKGICKLCQEEKLLSFEHVPPRSAFNKSTRYISVSQKEYIKLEDPLKSIPSGKIHQGGTGYHSFCEDCNNFLGQTYVPEFKRWTDCAAQVIGSSSKDTNCYRYIAHGIRPLFILKQIISMFIAMNKNWYFTEYPEIHEFVKNSDATELSPRFRIFYYLNSEGQMRHKAHSTLSSPEYGVINCTELAFPPCGYVMTFDYEGDLSKLTEITGFAKTPITKTQDIDLTVLRLPTYLPLIPLDYRSKEEIERTIKSGIAENNRFKDQRNDN